MNSVNAPSLQGLNTNLAVANKWVAYFPLESNLGKGYNDLELHLTRFSLPQLEMTSTEVAYRGYKKQIPTKVLNSETKELTLEYIVDADWKNYKALFNWMSGIHGTLNPIAADTTEGKINPTDYVPLRIYLLDNFKKKVIQFYFQNCWIKLFNDLQLEASNSGEIHHSFTCVYEQYTIENI